jgi:hypothetical protein
MNSTPQAPAPASSRRRLRPAAALAIAAAALAALTGCQASATAGASSAATPTQAAATSPAAPPSTTAAATPSATPVSTAPAVPVLGQVTGDFTHGTGFGQVRPAEIFNGGDPTGLVTKITWQSWGGATATGTGTGTYVGPNKPVAAGVPQSATVVAFNLGTCSGKLMYQAVEWYFPQHGQSFSSTQYEDVCTGTYVPAS